MNAITLFHVITFYVLTVAHACPIIKKNEYGLEERDVIYTGKHDIIKIYSSAALIPKQRVKERLLFFAEADINNDSSKVEKGIYIMIDNSTTKLLDNGNDIAGDGTGKVFFATNNGVYAYNPEERRAYKYGHLNEKIISLAVENNTDVIYALTENHILYKIIENGNKSLVDDRVKFAREIILDRFDNLYYYDKDTNLYVVGNHGAKKVAGLPQNPASIKLLMKSPEEEAIVFILDDAVPYMVYSNGTLKLSQDSASLSSPQIKPTAYSFDLYLILYFGHDKKIYEINLMFKILEDIFCKN